MCMMIWCSGSIGIGQRICLRDKCAAKNAGRFIKLSPDDQFELQLEIVPRAQGI